MIAGQLCAPIWNDWEKTTIAFSAALMQSASSALQSAEVTKGNNPKCDSNTNLFQVFYNRLDISWLTFCLMFPARAFEMREKLGRWQEQQLSAIFTAILPPYHLSSSLPAFFFPGPFKSWLFLSCKCSGNVGRVLCDWFSGCIWMPWSKLEMEPTQLLRTHVSLVLNFCHRGSTLYIVPWIIRTCFGFKSPFGEASTQVTSTTCRKRHRCWVMSGPVVTLKRRKMWCSIRTQVVIPATKDYSYFWKDFKEKYCEGCLPRVYSLYSTGSCSGVHVCLFQSHPLDALLILILWHCHANIGLIVGLETSLMNMLTSFKTLLT